MKKNYLIYLVTLLSSLLMITGCKKPVESETFIVNAGNDQMVFLPLSEVMLTGNTSLQPDLIKKVEWREFSNLACNIENTARLQTRVTGLLAGNYTFELIVTGKNNIVIKDIVYVLVQSAPPPPVNTAPAVYAGEDFIVIQPSSLDSLYGEVYDHQNNLSSIAWTMASGPSPCFISNPHSPGTKISNLVSGVYKFVLKAIDSAGLSSEDTVSVVVGALSSPAREVVFTSQQWLCPMECSVSIGSVYLNMLPGSAFKVYMRTNSSSAWEQLIANRSWSLSYGFVTYRYDYNSGFVILESSVNQSGSFDVKIVF